ncbi:phosphotransferase [SAR86 cluster bacterium]|nr:phosphotransferase [SAR86 cluster bacterium]
MDSISDDSSSWISSCFKTEETFSFSKLRTESSQRDYFRFNFQGKTFILMYAPKGIDESIESFCKKADVFKSFQVKVPEIYFRNDDLCHLIIEDFSDNLYQLNITQENSDIFIKSALDQLIRIQNIDCDTEIFDYFDLEKSIANKDLFIDFFCRGYLNLSDSSIPFDTINEGYNFILKRFYELPQCISHYDFETRNLIYLDSKETGVLDFQDAMIAPYALDLASIFKDLYMVWDKKQVDDWLDYYKKNTQNEEIKSLEDFKEDIEFCAMQRQIRILGKLSQVSITLNRDDRLNDFPVLLNYLIDSMSRYKELKDFSKFLQIFK